MTDLLSPSLVALALLQAAASPDAGLAASGTERWVELVSGIAQIVIAVALVVAAVALAAVALLARKAVGKLNHLASRLHADAQPILKHGQDVAENVNYISTSVRADVDAFKHTLRDTQARLERASSAAEQRLSEFNGLLEVVQEEAERIFIDTASTLRGVRAGADRLQQPRSAPEIRVRPGPAGSPAPGRSDPG